MDQITNHECETVTFPGDAWSANQALSTLRRMMGKAVETKRLPKSDKPIIKMRETKRRSAFMTKEQAALIAAHMEGDARDAFVVLRGTGMRPREVFCMKWQHLDLDKRLYLNPEGKTKSARRVVPFAYDETMTCLHRRHLEQGSPAEGWVFPSDSASGHMEGIAKAFRKARKAAGLPHVVCLYTARHGFLTDLAQVVTLQEVMLIGGHTDPRVALSYQHPDVKMLRAKLEAATMTGRPN